MKKIIYSLRTTFIAALLLFLNVQLMAQTPEITLLYPTGPNIELTQGGKYLISWTDNFQSTVDIYLRECDGTTYTPLATNISGSTWRWNTSGIAIGTQYRIKVQSHNSPSIYYDESDHDFSIVDQVNGYITLYQPTGGEVWAEGTKHLISWSDNLNAPVKVELLEDGQDNYTINGSTTANHIKWTVPTNRVNVGEKKFRIKISSTVNGAITPPATSGKFTITASTGTFIKVLQPNGREKWKRGTKHMISWNDDIIDGTVDIKLFKGVASTPCYTKTNVSGSTYKWEIPSNTTVGTDYKIVISDHATGSTIPSDESDNYFSITASTGTFIKVIQPNGREKWKRGTKHKISWNDDIIDGTVDIKIKGAADYIETNVSGSTYEWNIPSGTTVSDDYKIEISDHATGSTIPSDESDNYFSITASTGTFVDVLQPNGGEHWMQKTKHLISWNDDFSENVKIELYDYENSNNPQPITAAGLPNNVSGSTYSWTIPSGVPAATTYRIKITSILDENLSDVSAANFEIVAYAKGANKNADIINRMNAADVSVYPNPANQSINISLENADKENYSVEMYNCIGSLVMKTNIIPGSSNNISTSDLPNGIYFVNVRSGDTRISKKIIVRH